MKRNMPGSTAPAVPADTTTISDTRESERNGNVALASATLTLNGFHGTNGANGYHQPVPPTPAPDTSWQQQVTEILREMVNAIRALATRPAADAPQAAAANVPAVLAPVPAPVVQAVSHDYDHSNMVDWLSSHDDRLDRFGDTLEQTNQRVDGHDQWLNAVDGRVNAAGTAAAHATQVANGATNAAAGARRLGWVGIVLALIALGGTVFTWLNHEPRLATLETAVMTGTASAPSLMSVIFGDPAVPSDTGLKGWYVKTAPELDGVVEAREAYEKRYGGKTAPRLGAAAYGDPTDPSKEPGSLARATNAQGTGNRAAEAVAMANGASKVDAREKVKKMADNPFAGSSASDDYLDAFTTSSR